MITFPPYKINTLIHTVVLSFIAFFLISCDQHLINDHKTREQVSRRFEEKRVLANGRKEQLYDIFKKPLTTWEHEALQFLYAYMPLSDLADYEGTFYRQQIEMSLKARNELPWVKEIPENIYLSYVLPLRVNNEDLDTFRSVMYAQISRRVKGLSMKDAALEINHWCHEKVNYRGSDSRTSAPLSTVRTSWGRCGEESVFTVAAMRTAGIPARQVYTPRWAHTDDNHAWVEVWIDGKWYFLGACEPEPDLNMGWFAEPSRRAMLVHSRAWGPPSGDEPVLEQNQDFCELNLIDHYAPAKNILVRVTDKMGNPVQNARVDYRLYNYSEFYPIASNHTDSAGYSACRTGLGDLLIWVSKDSLFTFAKFSVTTMDSISLQLTSSQPAQNFLNFDLFPPVQPEPKPVPEAGQKSNQIRLAEEDSIRNAYILSFKDSTWGKQLAIKLKLNTDSISRVITKSYGNWGAISDFLETHKDEQNWWLGKFLFSLSDKDLRDVSSACLDDHFINGLKNVNVYSYSDPGFFVKYILSPRIGNELLRPWRGFLQEKFDTAFVQSASRDIGVIIHWVKNNIRIDEKDNVLSRCTISPKGVYELKVADSHSRNIFFVALCRSLGIPSRLNPLNEIPQYFSNSEWHDADFENSIQTSALKSSIQFQNTNSEIDPRYYMQYTVARRENGIYKTLELEEGKTLSSFSEPVKVDAGSFMLVTGNRLSDGSVMNSIRFFDVLPGQVVKIPVEVRTIKTNMVKLGKLNLSSLTNDVTGSSVVCKAHEKGSVVIWMDPGSEPAKHIMYDLAPFKKQFDAWGGSFFFLVPKEKTDMPVSSLFKDIPATSITTFDKNMSVISFLEKLTNKDLKSNWPVVIVCTSSGEVVFFSQGYVIGIGEQLQSVINKMPH